MKNALMMISLAGLAPVAVAQNSFSLSLVPSVATLDTTGSAATFTVEVFGDASVGTHMLGGAFGLEVTGAGVVGMSWANADWSQFNTDGGYAGGGSYNQVIFGQLILPGQPPFDVPADGSGLGQRIGSFQIMVDADVFSFMEINLVAGSPFALEVIDIDSGQTHQSDASSLTLGGASILVVPAPSSLALLGAAGLLAGRRRR